jgi:hypothetical protein
MNACREPFWDHAGLPPPAYDFDLSAGVAVSFEQRTFVLWLTY